ncbi:MAG: sigma 54-interacting transcriptional regulator [Gudongella sp.]|nr:sigma 54-interacting transcriptional regulator [Gudongella sp.]
MSKISIKDIPSIFKYVDFLVITDREGYIRYYNIFNARGTRIVEDPVGLHILEVHQHLDNDSSTVMSVLKNREPIINEKQYLNIFKERTEVVLSTTFPLFSGNEIIGAMDINTYIDKDHTSYIDDDSNNYSDNDFYFTIDNFVGRDTKILEIKNRALKAAKSHSPVMVYGESGTGKELIAKAIHNHSLRKDNPFIIQNCATIPSTLGESTLFGTTKGSFTGAENKVGVFDLANNGTLVLDELNSMEMSLQSKLLRVTETNSFRRVGGTKLINTDIKLVSVLNESPYNLIENKVLRMDLFYRLGVVLINIPPLRDRKGDIPILVDHFIAENNQKMGKSIKGVSKKAMEYFMDYDWPGNVRELRNFIEAGFNFAESNIIKFENMPHHVMNKNLDDIKKNFEPDFDLHETMRDIESKYIEKALIESKNLNEAAKLLKLSRQNLKYKIDNYGLSDE